MSSRRPAIDPRVAQTRNVVLEATSELLVDDGFERITIEAIADKSGVARSTIYRNWATRTELLVEAFEALCAFQDIPDLGSVEEELRFLGRELAHGLEGRDWGRALPSLVGAAAHDDQLADAQRSFASRRRSLVGAVIQRAIDRGDIGADAAPGELAERFAAGFFFRHLMSHAPLDDSFIKRQIAALISSAGAARGPAQGC